MPSVEANLSEWGGRYDWPRQGDEWSESWGGVTYQWWSTLFPRLQGHIPAARIVEIAPGYGRWTHFLKDLCQELVIVDIAEPAIAYCRERFADDAHVSCHVNDGASLPMVGSASTDLIFSCDSLVHVERDVLTAYLAEFTRILRPNGVAFIHHSNMGAYSCEVQERYNRHWRATTVSAEVVEQLAPACGLSCISQELLAWGHDWCLNDCFSVMVRAGSAWDRENVIVHNPDFSRSEIAMARKLSTQYAPYNRNLRMHLTEPDRP